MKDKTLIVSECFYSIQGEGQTAGTPAVFLRLAGCNLLCDNKQGWRCDTIEVWQKGTSTKFENVIKKEWVEEMAKGAHLIITGGEPMLHQDSIIQYLLWFNATFGWRPMVEIETNATILPQKEMKFLVNYWNLSPKLSNSGEPFSKRVQYEVLQEFRMLADIRNLCYKFVVGNEGDVVELLNELIDWVNPYRVWLMPAGATQDELAVTRPIVAELCKQFHFKYSERLHVGIWNKKTGV